MKHYDPTKGVMGSFMLNTDSKHIKIKKRKSIDDEFEYADVNYNSPSKKRHKVIKMSDLKFTSSDTKPKLMFSE